MPFWVATTFTLVSQALPEDFVRKKDKKRAAFYNYFSQNKWGDARHYHLAISSVYGVDFAVEVLKHAAESFPGGTEK